MLERQIKKLSGLHNDAGHPGMLRGRAGQLDL
jgi:hypothetical protein